MSLAALLSAACATNPDADDWGYSSGRAAAEHQRAVQAATDETTLANDARTKATKMRDDIDCESEVDRLTRLRSLDEAWHLMRECSVQAKWRNLRRLGSPMFRGRMRALPEMERWSLIAKVVANRGGLFEIDLPELQERGLAVHGVRAAFKDSMPAGALVMFRAELSTQSKEKNGTHSVVLREVARQTEDTNWMYLMRSRRTRNIYLLQAYAGSNDLLHETGVEIYGTSKTPHPEGDGKPMIYLAQLVERAVKQSETSGGLHVEVLGVYTAGAILIDTSR